MKSIKVSIFGADGFTCQIPRIKEGIISLGHTISYENPDLIYSNDPRGYKDAISLKKKYPNAFMIFNFLDLPWHMPNIEEQARLLVSHYLLKANKVTVISNKVKNDLKKFYNKEIYVIYNPIKVVQINKNNKEKNNDK